jgi:hypothetical protein
MINTLRIGFLIIMMTVFFLLINYYINNKIETQNLQAKVLLNRILYSDTINYADQYTFRIYPGIIDMQRLDDKNLDKMISYGGFDRHASARIRILNKDPDPDKQLVKEAYLNKETYDNMKNLLAMKGKGAAKKFTTTLPITYVHSSNTPYLYNNPLYGTMIIEIIIPNS